MRRYVCPKVSTQVSKVLDLGEVNLIVDANHKMLKSEAYNKC